MNTAIVQPTTASVNWQVVSLTPAELGQYDARNGLCCDPDAHFGKGNDFDQCHIAPLRGAYVLAYVRVKGL